MYSGGFGLKDHAGVLGHLPPTQSNVELVSKLELDTPGFGPIAPEQIADVSVHKNTAYLTSWAQPFNEETGICERGGVFSVDISNPAAPKQLAFRPALAGNYHGEGAHVITFPDGRDVLAVNNETCTDETARGGRRLRPLRRQRPGEPDEARRRGRRLRPGRQAGVLRAGARTARTARSPTSTTRCSCGSTTAGST